MFKRAWPIDYNAPFTLSFALGCVAAFLLTVATRGWSNETLFSIGGALDWQNPLTYTRFFLHVLGHASLQHLVLNVSIILLVAPLLEEKYGSVRLLVVATATALITGVVKVLFFPGLLMGASGVAFAFIILSSFARTRSRTIPLTFVLIAFLFLGNEIYLSFQPEVNGSIARFAHLIGGLAGGYFGFKWLRAERA